MITANILAHLVGDFILQPNALARWKSKSQAGVLVHGLIVLLVTLAITVPIDRQWWPWAVVIGVAHTIVDSVQLWARQATAFQERGTPAFVRFIGDQFLHLSIILLALVFSGYLAVENPAGSLITALQQTQGLTLLLGYSFIMMPAWVVGKFFVYGVICNMPADFAGSDKYIGMLERILITTFVLLGQYMLIPVVWLPRLLLETPYLEGKGATTRYVAELLTSLTLAVGTGLGLGLLAT